VGPWLIKNSGRSNLPHDFLAVEGFGQIKILAFGQIPAALS
jgi:hypothetical protein